MMNGHYWGMGWGMWFIPILVILVVFFFVRNYRQTSNGRNTETPIELAKKQYARGKINKEQFEQMKKDLL
ncbi:SHOCT domain-containing protein [Spirosoma spitsbergense]|uniref:SHOCT domain-containing protein n=1 Tax=Spirosoma spitsbergense TaxID=431554 RepID=UPI000365CE5D|nr:SHOCT domain-containing protein [Spirosoma spitsbergense]